MKLPMDSIARALQVLCFSLSVQPDYDIHVASSWSSGMFMMRSYLNTIDAYLCWCGRWAETEIKILEGSSWVLWRWSSWAPILSVQCLPETNRTEIHQQPQGTIETAVMSLQHLQPVIELLVSLLSWLQAKEKVQHCIGQHVPPGVQ